MSTNNNHKGVMVKSNKSGIIAAACAIVMLGGAVAFFAAKNTDDGTEIKTNYGAQVGDSSAYEDSRTEDGSDTNPDSDVSAADNGEYAVASPAAVIAPDDNGKIVEGFEGYDIEVKYLLEDQWKGIKGLAQHTYGVIIDVTAKEGYELPWADEKTENISHLGEVYIDNGKTGYFDIMKADKVETYGYKTKNEEGRDVLRFVIVSEVEDGFKLDKDTKIDFNVTVVYWGVGDNIKTEGKFTASVTFDEARTLDLALRIPYQTERAE